MSLIKEEAVRIEGQRVASRLLKTAGSLLEDYLAKALDSYDVFLSHSFLDAEVVLGVKAILEGHRHKVYVDWIADPQLSRSQVSRDTATTLKERMSKSRCLVYVTTKNSPHSKWMPWECGYFDGVKGRVAILPLSLLSTPENVYAGQEYLGLYPWVDEAPLEGETQPRLWVNFHDGKSLLLERWM